MLPTQLNPAHKPTAMTFLFFLIPSMDADWIGHILTAEKQIVQTGKTGNTHKMKKLAASYQKPSEPDEFICSPSNSNQHSIHPLLLLALLLQNEHVKTHIHVQPLCDVTASTLYSLTDSYCWSWPWAAIKIYQSVV